MFPFGVGTGIIEIARLRINANMAHAPFRLGSNLEPRQISETFQNDHYIHRSGQMDGQQRNGFCRELHSHIESHLYHETNIAISLAYLFYISSSTPTAQHIDVTGL